MTSQRMDDMPRQPQVHASRIVASSECTCRGECWAGGGGTGGQGVCKAEQDSKPLRAGHCSILGLGEEGLRALLSGATWPERLWGHASCLQGPTPSQPDVLSPFSSHQAMSSRLAFVLALLAMGPAIFRHDVETEKEMLEREEFLSNKMAQMLEEVEGSTGPVEGLLPSALQQHWLVWAPAAAEVVLLAWRCWLAWRRKRASASCREQERCSPQKKGHEQQKKLHGLSRRRQCASASVSSLPVPSPSPVDTLEQNLANECKLLKELVGDLLDVCRALSKSNFTPELQAASGTDSPCEAWNTDENSINYRLPVILRPPYGHFFFLGTTEQLPASQSRVRVLLECTCSRKQLLGHMSCLVHPTGKDRSLNLRDMLCTGNYLDVEKVAHWLQTLVASAWLLLPDSQHCQLTVLPSCRSCRFQLTGIPGRQMTSEMVFAVEQGSSGAYVCLE